MSVWHTVTMYLASLLGRAKLAWLRLVRSLGLSARLRVRLDLSLRLGREDEEAKR